MSIDQNIEQIVGSNAYDNAGEKIGKVGQIYLDDETGRPEWATVSTGLFGSSESFVPVADATYTGDELRVPYDKDTVKQAPRIDADAHLSESEEAELYRHYGLQGTNGHDTTDMAGGISGTAGRETSDSTTDDAMTRSEERLNVGTERRETGRARLRKYVVTEQERVTVPVTHEEVRVEREPITEDNRDDALSGQDISEQEHEVTLHAERPVVEKQAVPVERVRLGTETVTEEAEVAEDVRKERIETDGVDEPSPTDRN